MHFYGIISLKMEKYVIVYSPSCCMTFFLGTRKEMLGRILENKRLSLFTFIMWKKDEMEVVITESDSA